VDTTVVVLIVVIVVIALAAGALVLARQRRSQRLREHYGEEYERSNPPSLISINRNATVGGIGVGVVVGSGVFVGGSEGAAVAVG
jgi:hypothetical protein